MDCRRPEIELEEQCLLLQLKSSIREAEGKVLLLFREGRCVCQSVALGVPAECDLVTLPSLGLDPPRIPRGLGKGG